MKADLGALRRAPEAALAQGDPPAADRAQELNPGAVSPVATDARPIGHDGSAAGGAPGRRSAAAGPGDCDVRDRSACRPVNMCRREVEALFNTHVGEFPGRPILNGKTHKDRVSVALPVSPQATFQGWAGDEMLFRDQLVRGTAELSAVRVPRPCAPGDELCVMEQLEVVEIGKAGETMGPGWIRVRYLTDGGTRLIQLADHERPPLMGVRLGAYPARWGRLYVRVEQCGLGKVSELTEDEARREGAERVSRSHNRRLPGSSYVEGYHELFNDRYGPGRHAGPDWWVWMIWFRRLGT